MNYDGKGRIYIRLFLSGLYWEPLAKADQKSRLRADGDEASRRAVSRGLSERQGCCRRVWHSARGLGENPAETGKGRTAAFAAWHEWWLYAGAAGAHDFGIRGHSGHRRPVVYHFLHHRAG